jgi:hypothetical protein
MTCSFSQWYAPATPSFALPNPGSAPYISGYNGRTYTNTNGNYKAMYATVAYTDPIPLPDSSAGRWLNYANNNMTRYATYSPPDHGGYGYETPPQFPFRLQPIDMTPAWALAKPCADPNNLTTQLANILRESFGIEHKGKVRV